MAPSEKAKGIENAIKQEAKDVANSESNRNSNVEKTRLLKNKFGGPS